MLLDIYAKEEYYEQYPNELMPITKYFYLYDNNTILSGDYLDIENTFNDTYYNQYQNNLDNNYSNIQEDINNENIQNITNTIDNMQQQQEENNNWWKNTYNNLFTMNSGDVLDVFTTMQETAHIENNGIIDMLSGELALFTTEPTDFIISWNDIKIPGITALGIQETTLVPANSINFSAITRNNEALNTTHYYLRLILQFTLVWLCIKNIWLTIMTIIGVGTSLYEDNEEEKAKLETQITDTTNINADTGSYTQIRTIYNPRTRKRTNIKRKGK